MVNAFNSTYFSILLRKNEIYIVGAQSRAKTLTGYLSLLYPDVKIEAYLVDDLSQNDAFVQGVPVCKLDSTNSWHLDYPVFIATKGIYHNDIEAKLRKIGFQNIIPVTVEVDNQLRNAYVEAVFAKENRIYQKIDKLQSEEFLKKDKNKLNAHIYMAKSIYDKPLQSDYTCPAYEKPIQVGAALTSERLEPGILTDCEGENISDKNRQYCELTALYWIWKHATEDVIGLSHYRRHFMLPENWLELMNEYDIDVILPVPTYVSPNIEDNYRERHDPVDWDYLLHYLKEYYPVDYEYACSVYRGNLYSPCNMFIMRREILNELCTWMFPILNAVVAHGGIKADTYLNRYPGFISERLITLFFHKNRNKYKLVYANKNFIS